MSDKKNKFAEDKARRSFLFSIMASSPFILSDLSAGSANAKQLSGIHVIVVGAGVSGLAAAQNLKSKGAKVTILESKNRIGGRLYTDYTLGAPFEVGAGWIHGPSDKNPIKKLAKQIDARTFVTDDEKYVLFDENGNRVSDKKFREIDRKWASILTQIDDELEITDRRSLAEVIRKKFPGKLKDPLISWTFSAYTEFNQGGPIEEISAYFHDEGDAFDGKDVILPDGYDQILRSLSQNLDIKLEHTVNKIAYGGDGVTISCNQKDFFADYVVCSVPLGVLKNKTIKFNPPLPKSYQNKINRLGFGSVTKIAFKFNEAFWDPEVQYFGIASNIKGRWNLWLNYRTFCQQNILMGLSMGSYAKIADKMSIPEMTKDALSVLKSVWGEDVPDPSAAICTNWSEDAETFGAYSYPKSKSTPPDFDGLADGRSGDYYKTLFLCGEHTTFDYAGTLHGAYMTGIWAAEAIMEEEQP